MKIDTDVLIVGGGPAGASAAISLLNYNENISVTVIEQSDLDHRRIGEHVSSGIFGLLDYLKLSPEDFGEGCFLPAYGNTSYWGIDQPVLRDSIFTTESASYQLDRDQFDLTLLKHAFDRGGNIFPRTKCTQFVQLPDHRWKVNMQHSESGRLTVTAKFLLDATGRQAHVCRQIGIRPQKSDQLIGVGAYLQFGTDRVLKHDVSVETVENGWWYSATLPHNTMVVVFFSDADIISANQLNLSANWNVHLQKTRHIRHLVKSSKSYEDVWVRNAHTQIVNSTGRQNFLAVGDAAASFDPISSMGIGFAITSACHAGDVVRAELSGHGSTRIDVYQRDIGHNFENYLQLRQRIYRQERRWPESDFWIRRSL